ncbi:MAG: DUF2110 family protein [Candidatus Korarchaeota archaeon NZ13-K]|nr:MAG: DUF2110 family protein [Candidatus Korarchaeota archaeon NZ13-K]
MIELTRDFFIQERLLKGIRADPFLEELGWEIMHRLSGMEIDSLDLDIEEDGWVRVRVSGKDEGIAENLLCRVYGRLKRAADVKTGELFKGFITDLGKYGYGIYFKAFLDKKDGLYPLYEVRRQWVDGRRLPLRRIAKLYGLIDGLSMELSLMKRDEKGIYVSISPRQVQTIRSLVRRGRDILFIVGATPKQVRRALIKTGHSRDVSLTRTSFLSFMLVCKPGTQARGLIPRLGPHLPGAGLSAIHSDELGELRGATF